MPKKTKAIDMSSQPAPTKGGPQIPTTPLVEVRNSPVHGDEPNCRPRRGTPTGLRIGPGSA